MTTELWTVRGRFPVLWTIPFHVTWNGDDERELPLTPAVPLLEIQKMAVDNCLAPHGIRRDGTWMLMRSELLKVGTHTAPGTDPETCLSWERPRQDRLEKYNPEARQERDEFLDSIYQMGVGASRDEVGRWWYLFCNHALDWLINKEKQVDMYFVRLTPLPLRVNWRERLHHITHRKRLPTDEALAKAMGNPSLLSLNGNAISRTVDLELLPLWFKSVKLVEKTRSERLHPTRYAKLVIKSVVDAIPAATRIYRMWLAQKRHAFGRLVHGGGAGLCSLHGVELPTECPTKNGGINRRSRKRLYFLKLSATYRKKPVPRPNAPLPSMSDFQPEA